MTKNTWRGLHHALALALTPLIALGFTRFGYALLLPGMQGALHWSLAEAGALNTANGVGFLAGALTASALAMRWGVVRVFITSLVLSSLALVMSAFLHSWAAFVAVRALGGATTACAFVLGSFLAPLTMPRKPAAGMAFYFAGTGLGMVAAGSAYASDWLTHAAQPWRTGWLFMGCISVAATLICARIALQLPSRSQDANRPGGTSKGLVAIAPTLLANSLFGAGYVSYTTFVIVLLEQRGFGSTAAALVFCTIGLASMLVSPLWGYWLQGQNKGHGFAVICVLLALSLIPVLVSSHPLAVIGSALLFGSVFMAGPAAVSIVAQRELSAADVARGLGALTAAFSMGQAIGPVLSGAVADASGHLEWGLWLGPVLLLMAAVVGAAQEGGRWNPDHPAIN
jgi:predicted MFS family arabinose efflux permease